ncbi:unnamed protein product [Paramecium octaurelia]|uniref:Uncharacterized protein n=1 Tax=Paramecium octaurelia TaxID=43137 RepID=A0A8S1Y5Q1_PAROT|nr:unnamed protein product [Paramecium octaurelia]
MLNPILFSYKGLELEFNLAEEVLRLSNSLNFTLEGSPFQKIAYIHNMHQDERWNTIGAKAQNKVEQLNSEGYNLLGKVHLRKGELLLSSNLQEPYMMVTIISQNIINDDDLDLEWKNKII